MKIGIIGTGRMASGLGQHWAAKGHELMLGSRDPGKEVSLGKGATIKTGSIPDAAAFGEVIIMAVPAAAAPDTLKTMGDLTGKVLVDITNPTKYGPEGMELAVGQTTSAAEELAKLAPGASVVKAFNTNFAQLVRSGARVGAERSDTFYCGDDETAKAAVARLAEDAGFHAVDIGGLRMARFLEPFACIMIQLMRLPGGTPDMGYKLLRP